MGHPLAADSSELASAMPKLHAFAGNVTLTQITDTVYRADGSKAKGTLLISWPAFTTATQGVVAAGSLTVQLGPEGLFSAKLAPTTGSTPTGVYYRVVYQLESDTSKEEYWAIPATDSTTISAVRAKLVPANVAAQFMTRDQGDSSYVHAEGDQTVKGTKTFTEPPTVPDPQKASDVANKAYVDANAGSGNLASPPPIGSVTPNVVNATAATARSVNGVINPAAFGKADLAANVAAAISAYGCSSNTLCNFTLPPGAYSLASTLDFTFPVRIQGSGTGTTRIRPAASLSGAAIKFESSQTVASGLSELTIDMANVPGGNALVVAGAAYSQFRNLEITYPGGCSSTGTAFTASTSGGLQVDTLVISNPGTGVVLQGDGGQESHLNRVQVNSAKTRSFDLQRTTTTDVGGLYLNELRMTDPGNCDPQHFRAKSTVPNTQDPFWCHDCVADGGGGAGIELENMQKMQFEGGWITGAPAVKTTNVTELGLQGVQLYGGDALQVNGALAKLTMSGNWGYISGYVVDFMPGASPSQIAIDSSENFLSSAYGFGVTSNRPDLLANSGSQHQISTNGGEIYTSVNGGVNRMQCWVDQSNSGSSYGKLCARINNSGGLDLTDGGGAQVATLTKTGGWNALQYNIFDSVYNGSYFGLDGSHNPFLVWGASNYCGNDARGTHDLVCKDAGYTNLALRAASGALEIRGGASFGNGVAVSGDLTMKDIPGHEYFVSKYSSIQAAIDAAYNNGTVQGGAVVVDDRTSPYTGAGWTVRDSVTLKLAAVTYTVNATVQYNNGVRNVVAGIIMTPGSHMVGSGTSANHGTNVNAANGLNADLIATSTVGTGTGQNAQWWHWGSIENFHMDGNRSHQSAGHCINVENMGETAVLRALEAGNCYADDLHLEGNFATQSEISNITVNSAGQFGVNLNNFQGVGVLRGLSGDSNTTSIIRFNGNQSATLTVLGLKSEEEITGHDPLITIDMMNDGSQPAFYLVGGYTYGRAGLKDVVKIVNGKVGAAPFVQVSNFYVVPNFTNAVNDTVNSRTFTAANMNKVPFSYLPTGAYLSGQAFTFAPGTYIQGGTSALTEIFGSNTDSSTMIAAQGNGDGTSYFTGGLKFGIPNRVQYGSTPEMMARMGSRFLGAGQGYDTNTWVFVPIWKAGDASNRWIGEPNQRWPEVYAADVNSTTATVGTLNVVTCNGCNPNAGAHLLNYQVNTATLTGNNADLAIYSYTLPAGSVAAGTGAHCWLKAQRVSGTGSITYKWKFGSTTMSYAAVTSSSSAISSDMEVFNNPGSTTAQLINLGELHAGNNIMAGAVLNQTAAENTANATSISVSFNAAGTEQLKGVTFKCMAEE
jgi:hypothetical protein